MIQQPQVSEWYGDIQVKFEVHAPKPVHPERLQEAVAAALAALYERTVIV